MRFALVIQALPHAFHFDRSTEDEDANESIENNEDSDDVEDAAESTLFRVFSLSQSCSCATQRRLFPWLYSSSCVFPAQASDVL